MFCTQEVRRNPKWGSVEEVKLDRAQYFKALNNYIDFYQRRATLRFWLWRLMYNMRMIGVNRQDFKDQIMRCAEVRYMG
jgi:hypothetical protein